MHCSRHRLTTSVATWLRARTRQPMTNGLTLLSRWSVRQKLNSASLGFQFSHVALNTPWRNANRERHSSRAPADMSAADCWVSDSQYWDATNQQETRHPQTASTLYRHQAPTPPRLLVFQQQFHASIPSRCSLQDKVLPPPAGIETIRAL